jgi:hypothetical protein
MVDEEDIKNIKPLPNLDYRIMQGNSLISEFMGINFDDDENKYLKERISALSIEEKKINKKIKEKEKEQLRFYNKHHKEDKALSKELDVLAKDKNKIKNKISKNKAGIEKNDRNSAELAEALKKFKQKKDEFLNESNVSQKKKLKEEIDNLLVDIFETRLKTQKTDFFNRLKNIENKYSVLPNEKQRNEIIKQEKQKLYKDSGFDLETAEKQLKEFTSGRQVKPFFLWNLYFSEVFHGKGGFDVVIANPPYGIVYNKNFKQQLVRIYPSFKRNNDIYIAFYEQGLGLLRVGGVLIYISPNTFLNGDYFKEFRKILSNRSMIREIFDFKNLHIFEDPTVFVCTLCCQRQNKLNFPYEYRLKVVEGSLDDIQVENIELIKPTTNNLKVENRLYSRLFNQDDIVPAEEIFHIKDVGFNYWTKGRGKKRGGSIGSRVLYSGKPKNKEDTPFIKGRDISRFHIKNPTNFLVHDYSHHLDPKVDTFRFAPTLLEKKPKIIYRQTANRIIAALDTSGYYLDKTVHLIISKDILAFDMKYILGLLNSKLINYMYADIAQERKGRTFAQVKVTYIKKLPIKIPCDVASAIEQSSISALVNKILAITKDADYLKNPAKQAQVKEYENQIDQLVYQLYDLTDKEIKIVEGGTK